MFDFGSDLMNAAALLKMINDNVVQYSYNNLADELVSEDDQPIDVPNLADQRMIEDGKGD